MASEWNRRRRGPRGARPGITARACSRPHDPDPEPDPVLSGEESGAAYGD
jgi:hypothetical protein